MAPDLQATAIQLVAKGKGVLAADETPRTLTRRLEEVGIASTADGRRAYREMLFTAPSLERFVSGVILQDETAHQTDSTGRPLVQVLADRGILPGIKVDSGAKPLAGRPGETITEGLDGLRERLAAYREQGARFAKWRAVLHVTDHLPSRSCIEANAQSLARYAALCQEQGLVPIVEPEVLMDGDHDIARCEAVTGQVLRLVFDQLFAQGVEPEAMLLKPNMVIAGEACPEQASTAEVAAATLRCLRRYAPAAVPGIVFLSGGQTERQATANLDAINRSPGPKPWVLTFSYGRALQDSAMRAWRGDDAQAGAQALLRRAACNGAACQGGYEERLEEAAMAALGM